MANAAGSALQSGAQGAALGSVVPGVGTAIGAGVGVVGGLLGSLFGSGDSDQDAQTAAMQQQLAALQAVNIPPEIGKAIIVQQLQQQGLYTPEAEQAITQAQSAVANVQANPQLQQAQQGALQALQARGKAGLTAEDRAQFLNMQNQVAQDTEAKRQQIMQNAQARGEAGSGAELAAQLASAQSGAQNEAQQGAQLQATASQNALNAMLTSGQLGGQMQQQQFGQDVTKGTAADEMARFNVGQQTNAQNYNVGARNTAQQQNLAEKQRISEANVTNNYNEQVRQQQALAQRAGLELQKAGAQGAGYSNEANVYGQRAAADRAGTANIVSGIGQAATGAYNGITANNAANAAALAKQNAPTDYEKLAGISPSDYGGS